MQALVLLCLLHAALANPYSWDGPQSTTQKPQQDVGPVCSASQASCGCCLMQAKLQRLEKFYNFTAEELSKQVVKAQTALNNFKALRSAFSVALNNAKTLTCFGSSGVGTIIYTHIFLNLGAAYNMQTGTFTAPRSGVYSLAVTIYGPAMSGKIQPPCASLLVNGKSVADLTEKNGADNEDSSTIVMAVHLRIGDKVTVSLSDGCIVCDDYNHYNTFTGFLLFPTENIM